MLGRFKEGQVTDKSSLGSSNSLPTHDQRETLCAPIRRGESAPIKEVPLLLFAILRLFSRAAGLEVAEVQRQTIRTKDQWETYRIRRKRPRIETFSRSYWSFM